MRDHRPRTTFDLFKEEHLLRLQEYASTLAKINQVLATVLSEQAQSQCRVANYRQGILIIECTSPTWVTRLNYQRGELLSLLRQKKLFNLTTIEFKINPSLTKALKMPETHHQVPEKPPLSEGAARHLNAIAKTAPAQLKARIEAIAALSKIKK